MKETTYCLTVNIRLIYWQTHLLSHSFVELSYWPHYWISVSDRQSKEPIYFLTINILLQYVFWRFDDYWVPQGMVVCYGIWNFITVVKEIAIGICLEPRDTCLILSFYVDLLSEIFLVWVFLVKKLSNRNKIILHYIYLVDLLYLN
jgi:hypothetical protein